MITQLRNLLDLKIKIQLIILFLGMIVNSILEFVSIGVIPILVTALVNYDTSSSKMLNFFFINYFSDYNIKDLVIYLSFFLTSVFFFKSIFLVFLNHFENAIMHKVTVHLANNLYRLYLSSPYIFFKSKKSSEIIRNVTHVVEGVRAIYGSFLRIFREAFVVFAIFLLLIISYPALASMIFTVMALFTYIFYRIISSTLEIRGAKVQDYTSKVFKNVSESFGAITQIKLMGKEKIYFDIFNRQNSSKFKHIFFRRFVSTLPRIFLEALVVVIFLFTVFYFLIFFDNIKEFLPFISLLAICTARLMPSFSVFAGSFASIKFSLPDLNKIAEETKDLKYNIKQDELISNKLKNNIDSKCFLELNEVDFKYPNNTKDLFCKLNLKFNLGQIIGICGESGSGKSTLIELIMGLIPPNNGSVYNKGININNDISEWRYKIAYVPQAVYLLDDSIEKNISFADDVSKIDYQKLNKATKNSNLDKFINSLPNGLKTSVGERGSLISGGQLQRVGISRAMYRDFDLLILDEATNALDELNENEIFELISKLKQQNKLILMISHDKKLFKICDITYELKSGKLLEIKK